MFYINCILTVVYLLIELSKVEVSVQLRIKFKFMSCLVFPSHSRTFNVLDIHPTLSRSS